MKNILLLSIKSDLNEQADSTVDQIDLIILMYSFVHCYIEYVEITNYVW